MDMVGKECGKSMISELNGGNKRVTLQSPTQSDSELMEPIVYDYMKYANKKKNKLGHADAKNKKRVSFKRVVQLVTFSEDWKMKTSESNLRTEDEQVGPPDVLKSDPPKINILNVSLNSAEVQKYETQFLKRFPLK